jgi:hypothetical protein
LVAAGTPAQAQGPHADNFKAFNGTSLQGWRAHGAAHWRVANGEIVGTASGVPGWLAMDRHYQDIILRFAYQCDGCDAGVMNNDTRLDVLTAQRKGAYIFLNLGDAK